MQLEVQEWFNKCPVIANGWCRLAHERHLEPTDCHAIIPRFSTSPHITPLPLVQTARHTNAPPADQGHDDGDDDGDGGKGSPVGAPSPLRNVDTVSLVSMRAHTPTRDTSHTRSRSRSRGDVSVGPSLQAVSDLCAISDLHAASGPQSLQDVELFDGDPRWPSGEPSDLRATMHSVRTASGM